MVMQGMRRISYRQRPKLRWQLICSWRFDLLALLTRCSARPVVGVARYQAMSGPIASPVCMYHIMQPDKPDNTSNHVNSSSRIICLGHRFLA